MLPYLTKFNTLLMILIPSLQTNHFINYDLAHINKWLRANKISLNTTRTEIITFCVKNKRITKHLNFRISGQKVEPCTKVKYFGLILQEYLEWNTNTNN